MVGLGGIGANGAERSSPLSFFSTFFRGICPVHFSRICNTPVFILHQSLFLFLFKTNSVENPVEHDSSVLFFAASFAFI